jgi:ATP-dependent helicase/nuclease subunit A
LESVYPFADATRRPAALAVTSAVKPETAFKTGTQLVSAIDRDLPLPDFDAGVAALSGTDVGTATHVVMERLDVKRPCRGDDLDRQIAALVDQGHLTAAQAASVDRAGIEWFMDCPAGTIVRSARLLLREVPFCLLPGDPALSGRPDLDNSDRTVLRGGIDLLAIDEQDRVAIIDYKTDRVFGDDLLARVATYRNQLLVYSEAVRRLAKRPVIGCWLAFLTARELHDVRDTAAS